MRKALCLLVCVTVVALTMASPAEAARRKIYKPKPVAAAVYVPLFLGVGY